LSKIDDNKIVFFLPNH